MENQKQIQKIDNPFLMKKYSLKGSPALKLFNYKWSLASTQKINCLVKGTYHGVSRGYDVLENSSNNIVHLLTERSTSQGGYGKAKYGSDEDIVYLFGSFVNLRYSNVTQGLENEEEDAWSNIKIFSDTQSKLAETKGRLEKISKSELIEVVD
ncbi:hypothetical protein ISS08_00395 [Candidatus Pacearchaeota archaeon]|nr:hypothetical protein [Candidatus Pacearchaeota archaeon]